MQNDWQELTAIRLFSYGFLSLPIALASILVLTFVPTYYAVDLGVGLTGVGLVFVAGRLLDIFTDPLIGYASDRTISRFGSRIPWMIVGAALFIPTTVFLFHPPEGVTLAYTAGVCTAFFIAYTVIDLPYSASGLEMSPNTHERTRLASAKAAFQIVGSILAAGLVAAFIGRLAPALNTSAWVIAGTTLIGLWLFIRFVPRYTTGRVQTSLRDQSGSVWAEGPYKRLMTAFFLSQCGTALMTGLTALFVIHGVGDDRFTGLYIALVLIGSAVSLPVWAYLCRTRTKIWAWQFALLLGAALMVFVPLFDGGSVLLFGLFAFCIGTVFGADAVIPTSLLADMTDPEVSSAGLRLGYKNALSKMTFILPMGVAFPILGAMGFDQVGFEMNTAQAVILLGFFAFIPAAFRLAAYAVTTGMSDPAAPSIRSAKG